MVEQKDQDALLNIQKTQIRLSRAQELVPSALGVARQVKGFSVRWKMIIPKLEQLPSCLSDLSTHPYFLKNPLCNEQLQYIIDTLNESIQLAMLCLQDKYDGKLQMQSDLDTLSGKLVLGLKDCRLLIKTGVLNDVTTPSSSSLSSLSKSGNVKELLARLQIGSIESKHKALETLAEIMKEDEKSVLSSIGRSNVSALVNLLTATNPRIREKAVSIICSLAESEDCETWLVAESVLPPLIRLAESGSPVAKEKALISLQRFSMPTETACEIVLHGGVSPFLELCRTGESVLQAMAANILKNLSTVPEARQALDSEGTAMVMIKLLDQAHLDGSKEYAAQCLQNLTSSCEKTRRSVIDEGGITTLLAYLDCQSPQEAAVAVLRNLAGSASFELLDSLGFLDRLLHVLKSGSIGAKQAAASAICRICTSVEVKKRVAEVGCIPLLVKLLETKSNGAREVASQALASLMTEPRNLREVKRDGNSVPSLVQLLDPNPNNTAKKYGIVCLGWLASSKRCKRLMISHGAIGYLKKLTDMDVAGAKKLLDRLERGRLMSLLGRD